MLIESYVYPRSQQMAFEQKVFALDLEQKAYRVFEYPDCIRLHVAERDNPIGFDTKKGIER